MMESPNVRKHIHATLLADLGALEEQRRLLALQQEHLDQLLRMKRAELLRYSPRSENVDIVPKKVLKAIESLESEIEVGSLEERMKSVEFPSRMRVKEERSEVEEDVKPEVKPKTDGKVSCMLCEKRVEKNNFPEHALVKHMTAKVFLCKTCEFKCNKKASMMKHQRTSHKLAGKEDEYRNLLPAIKSSIKEKVAECFGDVSQISRPKINCKGCDKEVRAPNSRDHISHHHLKESVYSCNICDYTSSLWYPATIKKHMKTKHKLELAPDNHESKRDELLPALAVVYKEMFGLDFVE